MNYFSIYLGLFSVITSWVIAFLIRRAYRIHHAYNIFGAMLLSIGLMGAVSAYKLGAGIISAGTLLLVCGIIYYWVLARYSNAGNQ